MVGLVRMSSAVWPHKQYICPNKGWQKPGGLTLLLKSSLVKLCTSEAAGSGGTDGSSVVWSLCTPWCDPGAPRSCSSTQHLWLGLLHLPLLSLHCHPTTLQTLPLQVFVQLLLVGSVMAVRSAGPSSGGPGNFLAQQLLPQLAGLALLGGHSSPVSLCERAGGAEAAVNVTCS